MRKWGLCTSTSCCQIPLYWAAALGANWPSIPACAVKTTAGRRPLALLAASLRAPRMRAFAPRAGRGSAPRGVGRGGRWRWLSCSQRAVISAGRGESDALCSIVVTMTLRTSSRENSSWNICGTKLKRLRFSVRGSLTERYHMHAVHLHIDYLSTLSYFLAF